MFEEIVWANKEFPWLIRIFVFGVGACWGSFLNVVIYRIPLGKSVVFPGSRCSCGKPIAWFDNIPILSWFLLRGRARCCGAKFSFQYPFVELLTGSLFLACWWLHPDNLAVVFIGWLFLSMLICGTFIDLKHMVLPDYFTVYGAIIGVVLSFIFPQLHTQPLGLVIIDPFRGGIAAVIGMLIGSATILWIAFIAETILRKEAMGFGDVLFMGCIGAFCGWKGALFAIFGGAFIGTVFVIPMMLLQRFGVSVTPGKVENDPLKLAEPEEPAENAGSQAQEEVSQTSAAKKQTTADHPAQSATAEEGDSTLRFGSAIPFGPWLALGALVYYIFVRDRVDAYFLELIQAFQL